jgi:hypothetical protein
VMNNVFVFKAFLFLFFCSTGVWTQGLHLEPLLFCDEFFWDRVLQTILPRLALNCN